MDSKMCKFTHFSVCVTFLGECRINNPYMSVVSWCIEIKIGFKNTSDNHIEYYAWIGMNYVCLFPSCPVYWSHIWRKACVQGSGRFRLEWALYGEHKAKCVIFLFMTCLFKVIDWLWYILQIWIAPYGKCTVWNQIFRYMILVMRR